MEITKCKECGHELPKKEIVEIKHSITGQVLKTIEGTDLKYTDLRFANLRFADLEGIDLKYTDLRFANLEYANLRFANLRFANLEGASFVGAKTKMCTVNFSSMEYEQAKQFIEGLKL